MCGDLLHQTRYITDHITKRAVENHGELPMYLISDAHEGIIDKDTFEAVQAELKRRGNGGIHGYAGLPFRKMITCGACGQKFHHSVAGRKWWRQPCWKCGGRGSRNAVKCKVGMIPEDILMSVTAEVLGLAEFDGAVFAERVAEIRVPEHRTLVFVFKDGTEVRRQWQAKKHGRKHDYDGRRYDDE
jgi:hypothetical protein